MNSLRHIAVTAITQRLQKGAAMACSWHQAGKRTPARGGVGMSFR